MEKKLIWAFMTLSHTFYAITDAKELCSNLFSFGKNPMDSI